MNLKQLEDGAFGRCLSHTAGALINRISISTNVPYTLLPYEDTIRNLSQEEEPSPNHADICSWTSCLQNCKK